MPILWYVNMWKCVESHTLNLHNTVWANQPGVICTEFITMYLEHSAFVVQYPILSGLIVYWLWGFKPALQYAPFLSTSSHLVFIHPNKVSVNIFTYVSISCIFRLNLKADVKPCDYYLAKVLNISGYPPIDTVLGTLVNKFISSSLGTYTLLWTNATWFIAHKSSIQAIAIFLFAKSFHFHLSISKILCFHMAQYKFQRLISTDFLEI